MKNYLALLALAVAYSTVRVEAQSASLIYLGYNLQSALEGVCLATQDDTTDYSTDCFASCAAAGTVLVDMTDMTMYTGDAFNTGDFNNYINVFLIKLMSAMDSCSYSAFLVYVNNRLNDTSFLSGMIGNISV